MNLSKRQFALLAAIDRFHSAHGYPATNRDLIEITDITTTSIVASNRATLERHGLVTFTRGISRSTVLTPEGHAFLAHPVEAIL